MAVTLFLTNTDSTAALSDPPAGYWDKTNLIYQEMSPTASGSNDTSTTGKDISTNPALVLMRRWVSLPFERAATLTGAWETVIASYRSNASINATARQRLAILHTDGTQTVIDTVTDSSAWTTSATAQRVGASGLDTEIDVVPGECLVLEYGYSSATSSTAYTATIRIGGTDTASMTDGSTTGVTTRSPRILLSDSVWDTLWVAPPEPGVPQPITAVGSLITAVDNTSGSISINPTAIGNLFPMAVYLGYGSGSGTASRIRTITSFTGGNCVWEKIGSTSYNESMGGSLEFWYGVSTATGSSPIALTLAGSGGSAVGHSFASRQFTTSLGADAVWEVVDGSALIRTASSTSLVFPTLTADSDNQLYAGHIIPQQNGVTPSDANGWVWGGDGWSSQYVYKLNTGAGSITPPNASQSPSAQNVVAAAIFQASLPVEGPPPGRMLLAY